MANERALGVSFIYAAQTGRQLAAVFGEQEARAFFGLTNVLVMFGGSKDGAFNQEISDMGTVLRDPQWLPVMALLAEVAAIVGNPEQVKTLCELLRPYSTLVAGGEHIRFGSMSRYLGLLALALSRLDEAALFLQHAADLNDQIGAKPWSAHAKADLARVLLARDAHGDREAASDLLQEALATYQELGMTVAAGKVTAEVR
jgi:tetratricopeptide (TPR) repeat protein